MPAPATSWQIRTRELSLDRPLVLGILNVTPDSFSDGGSFFGADAAVRHAERLLQEGPDLLDVGGGGPPPPGGGPPLGRPGEGGRRRGGGGGGRGGDNRGGGFPPRPADRRAVRRGGRRRASH